MTQRKHRRQLRASDRGREHPYLQDDVHQVRAQKTCSADILTDERYLWPVISGHSYSPPPFFPSSRRRQPSLILMSGLCRLVDKRDCLPSTVLTIHSTSCRRERLSAPSGSIGSPLTAGISNMAGIRTTYKRTVGTMFCLQRVKPRKTDVLCPSVHWTYRDVQSHCYSPYQGASA